MLPTALRCLAVFGCVVTLSITGSAQQQGGGTNTGGTAATGNTGTGTGTGTATGSMTSLDADAVFSAVERSDTAGSNTATVGREDSAAAGGTRAAGGLGGGGGLGGFGGLGGLGSLFGGFGGGSSAAAKPAIRTRLRSAIEVASMPSSQVQMNATQRFRSLANYPSLNGINVGMRDRTAVITGVVPSARDRRMSELLIRLEPGVSSVDNQVVVSPASPTDR